MESNSYPHDAWVDARLAALAPPPDLEPDAARALAALRNREHRAAAARRQWAWAATAVAAAIVAVLVIPGTRATAQRLWDSLFLKRVDVVRVNYDDLHTLSPEVVIEPAAIEPVRDAWEAARKAGFQPDLAGAFALTGPPKLSVVSAITSRLTLRKQRLEAALSEAGADDIAVPPGWDGATIGAQIGPLIQAVYREMTLTQSPPPVLVTPPGFETPRLAEIVFRILRMDREKARAMSERFAANPAWFLGIPQDEQVTFEEVALRTGPGIYLEDFDDRGQLERVTVVWSTPDRVYTLSGKVSRAVAINAANSIE